MGSLLAAVIRHVTVRNSIIVVALLVFVAFSARAMVSNQDIPESIRTLVYALLVGGIAVGPVEAFAAKRREATTPTRTLTPSKGSEAPAQSEETEAQEATP